MTEPPGLPDWAARGALSLARVSLVWNRAAKRHRIESGEGPGDIDHIPGLRMESAIGVHDGPALGCISDRLCKGKGHKLVHRNRLGYGTHAPCHK
ncbi:MAG: hypothetical protein ACI9K5_003033, partial [Gammaproteobacteria bacterium]